MANVQVIQDLHKNAINRKKEIIVSSKGGIPKNSQKPVLRGRGKRNQEEAGTGGKVRETEGEGRRADQNVREFQQLRKTGNDRTEDPIVR